MMMTIFAADTVFGVDTVEKNEDGVTVLKDMPIVMVRIVTVMVMVTVMMVMVMMMMMVMK